MSEQEPEVIQRQKLPRTEPSWLTLTDQLADGFWLMAREHPEMGVSVLAREVTALRQRLADVELERDTLKAKVGKLPSPIGLGPNYLMTQTLKYCAWCEAWTLQVRGAKVPHKDDCLYFDWLTVQPKGE